MVWCWSCWRWRGDRAPARRRAPPLALDARVERRTERIVTALTVLTAVIVSGLSVASYVTGRSLAAEPPEVR